MRRMRYRLRQLDPVYWRGLGEAGSEGRVREAMGHFGIGRLLFDLTVCDG